MPFPDTPREIYRRNPLAQVICQLRFPPLLAITAHPPAEFQQRIRATYPYYKRVETTVIPQIAAALKTVGASLPTSIRHQFTVTEEAGDDGSIRTVTLDAGFLALTETDYTNWENFIRDFSVVRRAFEEIYEPADYIRIGLRYVNLIDREALGLAGTPWSALLNPYIAGLLRDEEVSSELTTTQAEHEIELPAVPGGLVRLRHMLAATESGDPVYFIDTDLSTTVRAHGDQVSDCLAVFNRVAGYVFRWAATPYLREALLAEAPAHGQ
jgi:uncharacterized protein (TIGR04255 family)